MHITLGKLRALIREAALTPTGEMALAVEKSGMQGDRIFILYDPTKLAIEPSSSSGDDPSPSFDNIDPSCIIAYIERDATGEIHAPVATKGYGPFIYEVAMAFDSKRGIFPDRESVSPSALAVWKRFASRDDVEKVPLEDALRVKDDPSDVLNYRYTLRGRGPDLNALHANHARIDALRKAAGDKRFGHRLWGVGHSVFSQRMRSSRNASVR